MKKDVPIAVIVAVVIVLLVGGFFLFRRTSAGEQGVMNPRSEPIQHMQELGRFMTQGSGGGPPKGMTPQGAAPMTGPGMPQGAAPMTGPGMPSQGGGSE